MAQNEAVPGETLHFHEVAINRSGYPVEWLGTTDHGTPFGDQQPVALPADQSVTRETDAILSPDAPLTQPYWLREEGTGGMYRVDDPSADWSARGQAEVCALTQSPLFVHRRRPEPGRAQRIRSVQVTADPAKGEIRRRLDVVPPVDAGARAGRGTLHAKLAASTAWKWKFGPPAPDQERHAGARRGLTGRLAGDSGGARFSPRRKSGTTRVLRSPSKPPPDRPMTSGISLLRATIKGKVYRTQSRQEIRYEHIPLAAFAARGTLQGGCASIWRSVDSNIGYLPGAGDRTAESLDRDGLRRDARSTGADLTQRPAARLRRRGRSACAPSTSAPTSCTGFAGAVRLRRERRQRSWCSTTRQTTCAITRLAPFDLELSRDLPHNRVTNEKAPVTLLAPDQVPLSHHAQPASPQADFDGWVQERGLNFPSQWDHEHFTANARVQRPWRGSAGPAACWWPTTEKGHFVYTGLSLSSGSLPAGVPGRVPVVRQPRFTGQMKAAARKPCPARNRWRRRNVRACPPGAAVYWVVLTSPC